MVRPEQVLKELSRLWIDLGHEDNGVAAPGEPGAGVVRACAMTLITIADESEDPTNLGETVALLMKEHPSRSVLIRVRSSGEECLESRVFAQCWMPLGHARQICCEQIEITASLASLNDVPGVVLPLAVPDLPVILWCRNPRLFDTEAFPRIAVIADKLIVDTAAFSDPAQALALLARQVGTGRLVADLAWARITRWRETLSQVFVNQQCLSALPHLQTAQVEYGGTQPATEALYLAAWLQSGLERAGNHAAVKLIRGDGPAVTALTLSGPGECGVSIRSDSSGSVHVMTNKLETRTLFPKMTDDLALQEELSITTRDYAFEAALALAPSLIVPAPR